MQFDTVLHVEACASFCGLIFLTLCIYLCLFSPRHISHSGTLLITITRSTALSCLHTPLCPTGHFCFLCTEKSSPALLCCENIFQQVSLFILFIRQIGARVEQRVTLEACLCFLLLPIWHQPINLDILVRFKKMVQRNQRLLNDWI